MPTLVLGSPERGFYADGDLEINGDQLGELEVLPGDSDSALADALNGVDGVTATLSDGAITVEWSGELVVGGQDPTGGGTLTNLQAGTYE
mgnify:CR=1 FL=1